MTSNFVPTQPVRGQCNGHLPDKYELFPLDAVIKEKSNELNFFIFCLSKKINHFVKNLRLFYYTNFILKFCLAATGLLAPSIDTNPSVIIK